MAEFELTTILSVAFVIAVGVAVGCTTHPKDLEEVFFNKEKAKLTSVAESTGGLYSRALVIPPGAKCFLCWMLCQFGCMPLLAFLLTVVFPVGDGATYSESAVALSIQLVGCIPGGATSNLFAWFAGGNVPLSKVMSWLSTVCSVFMTPLLLLIYYKSRYTGGERVDIPVFNIIITFIIMIGGVVAGMAILSCGGQRVADITGQVMAVLSLVLIVGSVAVGIIDDPDLGTRAHWTAWVVAVLLQPLGYACGLGIARFFEACWVDMKAISIETGIQNFGLSLAIIILSIDRDAPEYEDCFRVVALYNLLYVPLCLWIVLLMRYAFPNAQKERIINEGRRWRKETIELTITRGWDDSKSDARSGFRIRWDTMQVAEVDLGGPACRAGMREGHVGWLITHVDGSQVTSGIARGWPGVNIRAALDATKEPGRTFTIRIKGWDKEWAVAAWKRAAKEAQSIAYLYGKPNPDGGLE